MNKTILCPKCKGKGRVHDIALGVFTLGLGTFFELLDDDLKDKCPRCDGKGYIKLK